MTKAIATKDNVEAAAEKLLQDGVTIGKINAEQIKHLLGGGSYTTITPLLNDWKNERLDQHVIEVPMPKEIAQIIDIAIRKLWYVAMKMARAHFSTQLEDKEDLEEENKYLVSENKELETKINKINTELDQNKKRFIAVIEACKEGFFTQAGTLRTVIESNNPDAVLSQFEEFYNHQKELLSGALEDQHKIINNHLNNLQSSAVISESPTADESPEIDLETAAIEAPEMLAEVEKQGL